MSLKTGSRWSNWAWDKPVKAFIWRSSRICRPIGGLPPWFFEDSLPHLLLRNNSSELLVGLVSQPFQALWRPGYQEFLQVDRRRGTVCFGRLDGNRLSLGHFQIKAHHRLVHTADLLHSQRPVAEPLAIEDEQVVQHPKDTPIGNAREVERVLLTPSCTVGPPFEERVPVGIEQIALTGWEAHRTMTAAFIDQAKQGKQLRPGPIAQVHRVRMPAHVLSQPLEESGDRVVVGVDRITWQQSPVF